ncbi:MAG: TonB-dependent receptor [Acidobacteria bacterium]|nr:TonB-dependent receptor [Acidobacteriota bacterium]
MKKKSNKIFTGFFVLALFLFAAPWPLFGQISSGTISGTCRDESGGVLPGVEISTVHVDTGANRTALTNDLGFFHVSGLPVGDYEIRAKMPGFQTLVRRGLRLTIDQEMKIDLVLIVGEVSETLTVTGTAPLVETTRSGLSGLVDDRRMAELPLNGRSMEQLALLQVGVTVSRRSGASYNAGGVTKISIAGARPTHSTYLLDGTDINNLGKTTPGSLAGFLLGVEAIREFRIHTSSYSAEYGRSAGGVVSLVSKSGTNQFHGSIFTYHRNDNLDARNFFDREDTPEFKRNNFGFSAGGPISKDKTFFFGAYEGLREGLGLSQVATVPNMSAREGFLPDAAGRLQNIGVANVVKPYLALFPVPNGADLGNGTAFLFGSSTRSIGEDYLSVRVDHHLSDSNSLFVRYTLDDGQKTTPDDLRIFQTLDVSRNQYLTLQHTVVLSTTVVNAVQFGLNRSFTASEAAQIKSIPSSLDLSPHFSFGVSGGMSLGSGITSLGASGAIPRKDALNTFQLSDDLSINRGRHSLKTGVLIQRVQNNSLTCAECGGSATFGSLRDTLQGRLLRFQALATGSDVIRGWRQTIFGVYFQDDLRITSNLTLNAGLRWEFVTDADEVNGKAADFVGDKNSAEIKVGNPVFETDKNIFQPRVGFAWDPFGDGTTSVRSGFGIFHDQLLMGNLIAISVFTPPFALRADVRSPAFKTPLDPFNTFPTVQDFLKSGITLSSDQAFFTKTPYNMQWNLSVGREVTSNVAVNIGYIGSRGVNLDHSQEWNSVIPDILPDGRKFFPQGRPRRNSAFGRRRVHETNADSWYHALGVGFNTRVADFQGQVSYTFSKGMDTHSSRLASDFSEAGSGRTLDPENMGGDKALSAFNVRHNLSANYSYSLPFGKRGPDASGLAEKLTSGWQLNGIITLSSGTPGTIVNAADRSRVLAGARTGEGDRPNLAPGKDNNPVLGGPDRYFDPSAFQLQPAGFLGNLGRNTLISPGFANVDFSVFKNTYFPGISEDFNLQFRFEVFNIFNRTNFGSPFSQVFDVDGSIIGRAGRISSTDSTSRQIQFALKILF